MPNRPKKVKKQKHVTKKQRHTRAAKVNIATPDTMAVVVDRLLEGAVRSSSRQTYKAALHTICSACKCTKAGVTGVTKEAFLRFIDQASQCGNVSAEGYRAALLHHQRRAGSECWAASKDVILACKGAKAIGNTKTTSLQKGCMTEPMLLDLCNLHCNQCPNLVICRTCKTWFSSREQLVEATKAWVKLQYFARLRPGELELLAKDALVITTEWLQDGTKLDVAQLVFVSAPKKNGSRGERFLIPASGESAFHDASRFSVNGYLAPRCADTHIGALIADAAKTMKWSTALAWTAHAVRHSAFTALTDKITDAVTQFTSGVVKSTFKTYTSSK